MKCPTLLPKQEITTTSLVITEFYNRVNSLEFRELSRLTRSVPKSKHTSQHLMLLLPKPLDNDSSIESK